MAESQDRNPVEILADEFVARCRRGERPGISEYMERHPNLAEEIQELFPLLVEMEDVRSFESASPASEMNRAQPDVKQLGDYRIIREVGRGGMGIVYEAEQISLGRHVALKLLPSQWLENPKCRARFERESRAAARLHHTNIVPVFGVGEQEGQGYYVMQFIPGLGLDEVLDELMRVKTDPEATPAGELRVTRRDISAADVAKSLVTGTLHSAHHQAATDSSTPPASRDLECPPDSRKEDASNKGRLSDSFSLSDTSATGDGSQARRLGRKRVYWENVAKIGVQVAEALQHAHDHGILHRDIKPANLLLDMQGTVWVTDFGLAKLEDEGQLTQTGDILGTLRYMAPETFQGQADPRSEVYSLGLTLYELLARRPAFGQSDRQRLVDQVMNTQVDRLGRVDAEIPVDLQTIVHKAIEREPQHRYLSAKDFAADLQRFVDDEPIRARQLSGIDRLQRWARRHKAVAGLLLTLASVLLVGLTVVTLLWIQSVDNARIASTRADDLTWQDYVNRVNRAYLEIQNNDVASAEKLLFGCPADLRGWEWHHVLGLCHLDRLTIDVGRESINAVTYAPTGKWIAAGLGSPKTLTKYARPTQIAIFDVVNGRNIKTLKGRAATPFSIAASPDGKQLAIGSAGPPGQGAWLTVWDVESGRILWERNTANFPAVTSVCYDSRGESLIAGYGDYSWLEKGRVTVWDANSGTETSSFPGPRGGVNDLAYHPDGQMLAVAGFELVEIRDLTDNSIVTFLPGHEQWVYAVAFSPDGKWLASSGWDNKIKVRHVVTGELRSTHFGHEASVCDLAFAPGGITLASCGEDRCVKMWDMTSGRNTSSFRGHGDFVWSLAFHPDGHELATGSFDGNLRFWDVQRSLPVTVPGHLSQNVRSWLGRIAFRMDGQRVFSQAVDGKRQPVPNTAKLWDPQTGELDTTWNEADDKDWPKGFIKGVVGYQRSAREAMSPDGTLVAKVIAPVHEAGSLRKAFSTGDTVQLRNKATDRLMHELSGHTAEVVCVLFSPNGRRLATASADNTIKLWDVTSGSEVLTLRGHTGGVTSLAYSPDGQRLVSGGFDGTARVWNAAPLDDEVLERLQNSHRKRVELAKQTANLRNELRRGRRLLDEERFDEAIAVFRSVFGPDINAGKAREQVAWAILSSPNDRLRSQPEALRLALQLAKEACEFRPERRNNWNSLGVAHCRSGNWEAGLAALQTSMDLQNGGNSEDWFFMAIAHWHLGNQDEAQKWYRKAVEWMHEHEPTDATRLFQEEAANVLERTDVTTTN